MLSFNITEKTGQLTVLFCIVGKKKFPLFFQALPQLRRGEHLNAASKGKYPRKHGAVKGEVHGKPQAAVRLRGKAAGAVFLDQPVFYFWVKNGFQPVVFLPGLLKIQLFLRHPSVRKAGGGQPRFPQPGKLKKPEIRPFRTPGQQIPVPPTEKPHNRALPCGPTLLFPSNSGR